MLAVLREHKAALLQLLVQAPDDPLGDWLAQPVPRHTEPPTDALSVPDIEALQHRIAAYLRAAEHAIAPAALDAARHREARTAARKGGAKH